MLQATKVVGIVHVSNSQLNSQAWWSGSVFVSQPDLMVGFCYLSAVNSDGRVCIIFAQSGLMVGFCVIFMVGLCERDFERSGWGQVRVASCRHVVARLPLVPPVMNWWGWPWLENGRQSSHGHSTDTALWGIRTGGWYTIHTDTIVGPTFSQLSLLIAGIGKEYNGILEST